tara:strand:+ start:330 stop:1022 length:693 start_codon:yes stop_codon:yes gene_type:complete
MFEVNNLIGFGAGIVAAPDVTVSFTADGRVGDNQAVYTFNTTAIGAEADRTLIVIAAGGRGSGYGGDDISGVTVDDVACTKAIGVTDVSTNTISLWYITGTSGTTGNIVITFNGTMNKMAYGVWAVYNSATTPTDTDSNKLVDPQTLSLTMPAGGVAICSELDDTASTYTWTDNASNIITERFDDDMVGNPQMSGADAVSASAVDPYNVTADGTGTAAEEMIVGATFGKA